MPAKKMKAKAKPAVKKKGTPFSSPTCKRRPKKTGKKKK